MATVLSVSHDILIIGGAICMILLMIGLFVAIGIGLRISSLVRDIKMKYEMVQSILMIPLQLIMHFFEKLMTPSSTPSKRKKA